MAKITSLVAIKKYMERDDSLSPGGGRKVETKEFAGLSKASRDEMALAAAKLMGMELEIQA